MFGRNLSKFKINKFEKEIEPQEVLLDSLAQKKEREFGFSEKKLEVPLSQASLRVFWFVFLILIIVFFGKTFQLQVLEGKTLSKMAEENKFVSSQIQAERGVIYDKNMKQVVFNKPSFDWVCDGQVVAENLDHESLIFYEVKGDEFPNCEIRNNTAREYLDGPVFAHLVGYQRKTGEATGLEKLYNDVLETKAGEIKTERDVYGNPISKEIVSLPESGESLVLWLDSDLQRKAAESLERSIRNVGAAGGSVIALDPKTGGVLALANFPSFDNNLFSQDITEAQWQALQEDERDPLFNRAIAGGYLTGSTIKPLIASAVLEEKIISPQKQIYSQGFIEVPHQYNPEIVYTFHDWAVHGWVDMRKAIAQSSNVYFYTVGGGYGDQPGLGPSRIKEYLELFGWGAKTGIDLPGETAGFIPDAEWKKETFPKDPGWWDGDTYNLAIGQGFLQISPIEVVTSFAAIASGGTLYQPQVVQKIIDSDKNTVQEFTPEVIRQNFINSQNLQIVREGMRQAVTGVSSPLASAVLLNSLPVAAAAKTGTAQLGNDYYHNWVTVFAPYDDPQIVLTVLIEKVEREQVAALPVAREILEWYFSK